MKTRAYLIHALSPLHAGTGQAVDIIDLPIARMKGTGIPYVPGSSVKGVLREEHRLAHESDRGCQVVFGPLRSKDDPAKENNAHAGALLVSDARLLLLPVRSFVGTFAYVTSPLLLRLARRDLMAGDGGVKADAPPAPAAGPWALVPPDSLNLHGQDGLYLEDQDLKAHKSDKLAPWATLLAERLCPEEPEQVSRRLVVVDDETMTFLWETATQVDTRVRINPATGVVEDGALWTEESLPVETVLLGLLMAQDGAKQDNQGERLAPMIAEQVLDHVLRADAQEEILQFGGKATVGRGRCRFLPAVRAQAKGGR